MQNLTPAQLWYLIIGLLVFWLLIAIAICIAFTRSIIRKQKRDYEFRKNLKVGDYTYSGQVTAIDGDSVSIISHVSKDWIYPPKPMKK